MKPKNNFQIPTEEKLFSGIMWLNTGALGLALGMVCGLFIFIATNWLVIEGGPGAGSHLQLLSHYFIGYNVSFWGSLIGFAYGFAVGTLGGALIGWVYNKIVKLRNPKSDMPIP